MRTFGWLTIMASLVLPCTLGVRERVIEEIVVHGIATVDGFDLDKA